jgi:phospholipid/cholesterol/gamma-HCH transport system permease protein
MTAELGTMAVSDEIDSLRVLGIQPTRYLAMPRIVASLVMNPLLTVYASATGLVGGALLSSAYLGVGYSTFWTHVWRVVDLKEINTGLIKALTFGALYSTICIYYGLTTRGGAEGVGRSTTRAVVVSLTSILVADFLLTRALFG